MCTCIRTSTCTLACLDTQVSHVVLGLRTAKGAKQLKLDPTIYDALQKEKVQVCMATYM